MSDKEKIPGFGENAMKAAKSGPIRIMIILVVVATAGAGYMLLSKSDPQGAASVATPPSMDTAPGGRVQGESERYQKLVAEEDRDRADVAASRGGSAIPTMPALEKIEELEPQAQPDLEVLREKVQAKTADEARRLRDQATEEPAQTQTRRDGVFQRGAAQQDSGDRQIDEIRNNMMRQIEGLAGRWTPGRPVTQVYATADEIAQGQRALVENAVARQAPRTNDNTVLHARAGDILYARVVNSVVSTMPGPIVVEVQNGPLKGARMIGGFTKRDSVLVPEFTSISMDNGTISIPVQGIGIDPVSARTGVASDVYKGYFERYGIRLITNFAAAYFDAKSQPASVTVIAPDGTAINQRIDQPDEEEALYAGLRSAGGLLANDANSLASGNRYPIVYLNSGDDIAILLVSDVVSGAPARGQSPQGAYQDAPGRTGAATTGPAADMASYMNLARNSGIMPPTTQGMSPGLVQGNSGPTSQGLRRNNLQQPVYGAPSMAPEAPPRPATTNYR